MSKQTLALHNIGALLMGLMLTGAAGAQEVDWDKVDTTYDSEQRS